jgi:hypothetical protein
VVFGAEPGRPEESRDGPINYSDVDPRDLVLNAAVRGRRMAQLAAFIQ